ncbi:6-carboxytetrahydropterin synthase [Sphingobacterium sp. lm-10]|uniref:6-pyruvoyl trahydropterin synthase family protein n=1 Tax=Sphingobacterium sp. lm-10 TaxID=2944904 RepID=UPI002021A9C9|nr:6-carboxytetrahydropterin synthase [Sphingobacterium sp. lm-10]MCL7988581.1 6-carboxytetrahydropterin synthase [Sphingobacterium sp. lm-10]
MVYITRRERFSAAHRLFRADWSNEENLRVFGNCSNPNWHGHNYELFVTVKGEVNPETGFVMDLKQMKSIINEYVIRHVDHKNINLEVAFMRDKMASTEVIAQSIFEELQVPFDREGVILHAVRLHETENNYAEYFGSNTP